MFMRDGKHCIVSYNSQDLVIFDITKNFKVAELKNEVGKQKVFVIIVIGYNPVVIISEDDQTIYVAQNKLSVFKREGQKKSKCKIF